MAKRSANLKLIISLDAELRQKLRDAANELRTSESNIARAFIEYMLDSSRGDPREAAIRATRRTVLWDVLAAVRLSATALLPPLTEVVHATVIEIIARKFNPPPIPSLAEENADLFAALDREQTVEEETREAHVLENDDEPEGEGVSERVASL